jgi:hypothetical protein
MRPATPQFGAIGPVAQHPGRERGAAPAPRLTVETAQAETRHDDGAAGEEPRSSLGTVPGAELPPFVYISVLAAFGWIMLASLFAFARDADAGLALGMAVVLAVVFFALPLIIRHVANRFNARSRPVAGDFLSAPVETATGPLKGSSAWLQVLLIPLALAIAATLIGGAYLLVR